MIYIVRINDTEYEVDIEEGMAEIVNTQTVSSVSPVTNTASSNPSPSIAAPAANEELVTSPLPGSIVEVMVKPSDVVKKGQLLVVLEAMKMENEIFAPKDGRVKTVLINKGTTVATGDTLLTLE